VDAAGKEEGVYRARFAADAPTLGASLPECARDWEDLEVLMTLSRERACRGTDVGVRKYVLGWDKNRNAPSALLDADAKPADVLAAALAATKASVDIHRESSTHSQSRLCPAVAEAAYAYADARFVKFEESMRAAGWRVDFVQMGTAPKYRLDALAGGAN
jgi:hypothetical protein